MRINNNIMAINTYRQLGVNESSASKSLEKLSSGLRINRAGDDAAGLAISEKMRGQIRGLTQAARNSQDAISLIQTAEGALSETQAILQRMRELAVQAANGTYDEVERTQIQDEINQLTSEINRIGNTTEFNKKKLLEGSMSIIEDALKNQVADNSIRYSTGNLSNIVADASKLDQGNYKVSVSKESINKIGEGQVADKSNLGDSARVDDTVENVDLAEGSYKVEVTKTTDPIKEATIVASGDDILNTDNNTAIKVSANSNLDATDEADSAYQIDVTKNVNKYATGSEVTGVDIEDGDVVDFDNGTRFDVKVTAGINTKSSDLTTGITADGGDADGEVLIKTNAEGHYDDKSAITNLSIKENSAYDVTDDYSIKVDQLGDTNASKVGATLGDTLDLNDLSNLEISIDGSENINVALDNVKNLGDGYTTGDLSELAEKLQSDISAVFDGEEHGGITFKVEVGANKTLKITSDSEVIGHSFSVSSAELGFNGSDSSKVKNNSEDVKLRFSLENNDGVVASSEHTFTENSGAQTVKLDDITFNVSEMQVFKSDSNLTDDEAGNFHNLSIELNDTVIQNQVAITMNDGKPDEATVTKMYSQTAEIAENQSFSFGTGKDLTIDITGKDLASGQESTTIVDVETTYDIEFGKNSDGSEALTVDEKLGSKITLSEADLADSSNLTNVALGEAGNGLFADFDAAKLRDITVNNGTGTASLQFDIKSITGESYKATVVKADGTIIDVDGDTESDFMEVGLTSSDTDGETINFGNGIKFSYQGNQLSDSGDVFFSVKLGEEKYTASLDKVDENGIIELNLAEDVSFRNGSEIVFEQYGLSINTADEVDNGDNATFEIQTVDELIDNSVSMQIGANSRQMFKVDISDMTASALGVSSESTEKVITDKNGKVIEGAVYTETNKVTNDGTENEYALSVEGTDNATAAIDAIENALTAVSNERAKLGSIQNRLEHTINNLNTSSENLQAAESRIRDVDMAEEMMEYTKNNILQQAAQAMLAQANQAPQGVLQLLR